MDVAAAAELRRLAERDSLRLSEHERDRLAVLVITLGYIRRATIQGDYRQGVTRILRDLAPTFTRELDHLMHITDEHQKRMHP